MSSCFCHNATIGKRILLLFQLLNNIATNKKDTETPLTYTSFGSGKLLYDYYVISELIKLGFKNIKLNLIDLIYEQDTTIVDIFKQELSRIVCKRYNKEAIDETFLSSVIQITTYKDAAIYAHLVEQNQALKSDVLTYIDIGLPVTDEIFKSLITSTSAKNALIYRLNFDTITQLFDLPSAIY